MDSAGLEAVIIEKIKQLQDLNKQMEEISQKIGALQEQGRALHAAGLQLKGAIESIAALKDAEDKKAADLAAKLTLPERSLVASDGKTALSTPVIEAPVLEEVK